MHTEELEKQIDFLMTLALQKCGDIQEAEELTQETLLTALTHLSQGKTITNLQGWLTVVLNRRFYDRLRKKYRQPSVSSIGVDFDLPMEDNLLEKISATEEAESVRKEVAYLAKIYWEVIVRHYMDGESIADIASALNIPEGTIKRRLNTGRNQTKKGLKDMEKYSRPSYQPVTLHVGFSGHYGLNGEPTSLVQNDLVAQNLLWLAYEKPLTMDEFLDKYQWLQYLYQNAALSISQDIREHRLPRCSDLAEDMESHSQQFQPQYLHMGIKLGGRIHQEKQGKGNLYRRLKHVRKPFFPVDQIINGYIQAL